MKTNQELRLELDQISQEMLRLFQKVSEPNNHKEDIRRFVEAKDRFNTILSQLAHHEHALGRLIIMDHQIKEITTENEREFVMEIGTVLLSKSDDYGILAVVFKDGEIWVVKEFSFKEEETDQPNQPKKGFLESYILN